MKNDFRQLVDRNLSELQWDGVRTQKVLHALKQKGEPKMKKKFSMGLVLAMVCVLLATVAVAAGLTYSQRYQQRAEADALLENRYGITPNMQSFFTCIQGSMNDTPTYIYVGLQDFYGLLGSYTVVPEAETVVWSLDGQAHGWGADKMAAILLQCQEPDGFARACAEAGLIAKELGMMVPDEGDLASDLPVRATPVVPKTSDAERAKSLATLSIEKAESLARMAIQQKYLLTEAQFAQMEFVPDSTLYKMVGETPLLSAYFWLCQSESGWTDKDGIYIVNVNMLDGTIESIWYDTVLLGNG